MNKYTFKQVTDFEKFNDFSEKNGGSIYQTSYWAGVKSAWRPFFYMGFDGGSPVLCALCLERDVKVGKLWYIPDGFVCDLFNKELVGEFAAFLKGEMKRNGAFAAVCDPVVVEKINREPCDFSAINSMLESGFVLNDDKSFYVVQPNVTIETTLRGLTPEQLLKKCEKGVRHGLNASKDGALVYETYDNATICEHPEKLDDFFDVLTETSDRVSFIQRDKEYYKKIITALNGKALMDVIYCDNVKRREIYNDALAQRDEAAAQLEVLENAEKKDKKKIAAFKKQKEAAECVIARNEKVDAELKEKYGDSIPDKICLSAGITSRFGKQAICLYGGTKNLLRNTLRPTHFLNWTRILKSYELGVEQHDLGRITGDPYDENNHLYGLCRYKQSYNGDVKEFVGDMYLVVDKLRFTLFRKFLPAFKTVKNTVFKKLIKSETVKHAR